MEDENGKRSLSFLLSPQEQLIFPGRALMILHAYIHSLPSADPEKYAVVEFLCSN
jgi:hypothetical protein